MQYLVRFVQQHENFRKAEIEALATLSNIDVEFLEYSDSSPFAIVNLSNDLAAKTLISRSILSRTISHLWSQAPSYPQLHASIKSHTQDQWPQHHSSSFKFTIDSYQGKRSPIDQISIINSFRYLPLSGPISLRHPQVEFLLSEEWEPLAPKPYRVFFSRLVGHGGRDVVAKYDLKKRSYISTTSMDAELSLLTANMALADQGKLFYDPFVGTGSFLIAGAHFGAMAMGSDIDGRSFRGKVRRQSLVGNFEQYGLKGKYLDCFTSDLTNSPIMPTAAATRGLRWLDGIMCDPPYGVREGLKVLGSREGKVAQEVVIDGVPAHYTEGYVAPKKPYSFEAMLYDVLNFAASTLVDNGRLSMWMPTANEDDIDIEIPQDPRLEVVSVCVQPFNKWSRRLLTYRRLPGSEICEKESTGFETRNEKPRKAAVGKTADDLNAFRRKYFAKVQSPGSQSPKVNPESKANNPSQEIKTLSEQLDAALT